MTSRLGKISGQKLLIGCFAPKVIGSNFWHRREGYDIHISQEGRKTCLVIIKKKKEPNSLFYFNDQKATEIHMQKLHIVTLKGDEKLWMLQENIQVDIFKPSLWSGRDPIFVLCRIIEWTERWRAEKPSLRQMWRKGNLFSRPGRDLFFVCFLVSSSVWLRENVEFRNRFRHFTLSPLQQEFYVFKPLFPHL